MELTGSCPNCGASWQDGKTCQNFFHQMLYWEAENPANGEVHHLTVLCYHLQHPGLYSQEGLVYGIRLLKDFVEGKTPQEVRERNRERVASGNRKWKIKGTPGNQGAYRHPVKWSYTAETVVKGGIDHYRESVRQWAQTVWAEIQTSGNYPGE